jgi:hypothetical protein
MAGGATSLALGTVQFGLAYGVAGHGAPVPEAEVRAILECAAAGGIRVLDTAPAYGDIEGRLAGLIGGLPFQVVSKIQPLPAGCTADVAVRVVAETSAASIRRLSGRLTVLLFHRGEDLMGPHAERIWRAAEEAAGSAIRIGVSCYDPADVAELRRRFPIAVAQVPGNAFDQRLRVPGLQAALEGVEVHLRSVYLQGLLLLPTAAAVARVPAAAAPLVRWRAWCAGRDVDAVTAALACARDLPGVSACVIGVDRLDHLEQTLRAWAGALPCEAPLLACGDVDVIDPRRWPAA